MKHKNGIFKKSAKSLNESISFNLNEFLKEDKRPQYQLLRKDSVGEVIY